MLRYTRSFVEESRQIFRRVADTIQIDCVYDIKTE